MVTPCRISPPCSLHLLTRRATQRQYWIRPNPLIVANILYILGYLQRKYSLDYHAVVALANHLHLLLTDVLGDQIQPFHRELFSLLARSLNCYWGRNENFWSSDKPSSVLIAPRVEDFIDHAAYVRVNSVEAGLVSHSKKWPGVNVIPTCPGKTILRIKRPLFFYDPNGSMPDEVEVTFTLPKLEDTPAEELLALLRQEINRREQDIRDRFSREGRKFLGAKRARRVSPRSSPKSPEAWFNLNPHVACKDRSLRVRFLQWRKARQARYRDKRAALLEGQSEVTFPEGTYALHFVFGHSREPWKG